MIDWTLEEVDVEDVACTVDDMDGTNRSQTLVEREWSEGRVERGHRNRIDGKVLGPPTLRAVDACQSV